MKKIILLISVLVAMVTLVACTNTTDEISTVLFSNRTLVMEVGDTATLTLDNPGNVLMADVVFGTENNEVVTVSDAGVVTALGSGFTAVSLTYNEQIDYLIVTVIDPNDLPVDGREITLRVNQGYIQWQYVGETAWTNLVALESLLGQQGTNGSDGDHVEFRVENGYIQWKYLEATTWTNLLSLVTITGTDGSDIELKVSETHIQWKKSADETWTNLVSLASLAGSNGEDGKQVEFQTTPTHIQWRYQGELAWTNLVLLSDLKGQDGVSVVDAYFDLVEGETNRAYDVNGSTRTLNNNAFDGYHVAHLDTIQSSQLNIIDFITYVNSNPYTDFLSHAYGLVTEDGMGHIISFNQNENVYLVQLLGADELIISAYVDYSEINFLVLIIEGTLNQNIDLVLLSENSNPFSSYDTMVNGEGDHFISGGYSIVTNRSDFSFIGVEYYYALIFELSFGDPIVVPFELFMQDIFNFEELLANIKSDMLELEFISFFNYMHQQVRTLYTALVNSPTNDYYSDNFLNESIKYYTDGEYDLESFMNQFYFFSYYESYNPVIWGDEYYLSRDVLFQIAFEAGMYFALDSGMADFLGDGYYPEDNEYNVIDLLAIILGITYEDAYGNRSEITPSLLLEYLLILETFDETLYYQYLMDNPFTGWNLYSLQDRLHFQRALANNALNVSVVLLIDNYNVELNTFNWMYGGTEGLFIPRYQYLEVGIAEVFTNIYTSAYFTTPSVYNFYNRITHQPGSFVTFTVPYGSVFPLPAGLQYNHFDSGNFVLEGYRLINTYENDENNIGYVYSNIQTDDYLIYNGTYENVAFGPDFATYFLLTQTDTNYNILNLIFNRLDMGLGIPFLLIEPVFTEVFTVTFLDANGNEYEVRHNIKSGSTISLPDTDPTKPGETFTGWLNFDDQTPVTSNITVSPTFEVNSYDLIYMSEGIELFRDSYEFNEAIIPLSDPTRTGFTFKGWSPELPDFMPDQDVTVAALWEIDTFTVEFVDFDGSVIDSQVVDYNSSANAPADPQREGYVFTGWNTTFDQVTQDLTVTAKYQAINYAITVLSPIEFGMSGRQNIDQTIRFTLLPDDNKNYSIKVTYFDEFEDLIEIEVEFVNGRFEFVMPAYDVLVEVIEAEVTGSFIFEIFMFYVEDDKYEYYEFESIDVAQIEELINNFFPAFGYNDVIEFFADGNTASFDFVDDDVTFYDLDILDYTEYLVFLDFLSGYDWSDLSKSPSVYLIFLLDETESDILTLDITPFGQVNNSGITLFSETYEAITFAELIEILEDLFPLYGFPTIEDFFNQNSVYMFILLNDIPWTDSTFGDYNDFKIELSRINYSDLSSNPVIIMAFYFDDPYIEDSGELEFYLSWKDVEQESLDENTYYLTTVDYLTIIEMLLDYIGDLGGYSTFEAFFENNLVTFYFSYGGWSIEAFEVGLLGFGDLLDALENFDWSDLSDNPFLEIEFKFMNSDNEPEFLIWLAWNNMEDNSIDDSELYLTTVDYQTILDILLDFILEFGGYDSFEAYFVNNSVNIYYENGEDSVEEYSVGLVEFQSLLASLQNYDWSDLSNLPSLGIDFIFMNIDDDQESEDMGELELNLAWNDINDSSQNSTDDFYFLAVSYEIILQKLLDFIYDFGNYNNFEAYFVNNLISYYYDNGEVTIGENSVGKVKFEEFLSIIESYNWDNLSNNPVIDITFIYLNIDAEPGFYIEFLTTNAFGSENYDYSDFSDEYNFSSVVQKIAGFFPLYGYPDIDEFFNLGNTIDLEFISNGIELASGTLDYDGYINFLFSILLGFDFEETAYSELLIQFNIINEYIAPTGLSAYSSNSPFYGGSFVLIERIFGLEPTIEYGDRPSMNPNILDNQFAIDGVMEFDYETNGADFFVNNAIVIYKTMGSVTDFSNITPTIITSYAQILDFVDTFDYEEQTMLYVYFLNEYTLVVNYDSETYTTTGFYSQYDIIKYAESVTAMSLSTFFTDGGTFSISSSAPTATSYNNSGLSNLTTILGFTGYNVAGSTITLTLNSNDPL